MLFIMFFIFLTGYIFYYATYYTYIGIYNQIKYPFQTGEGNATPFFECIAVAPYSPQQPNTQAAATMQASQESPVPASTQDIRCPPVTSYPLLGASTRTDCLPTYTISAPHSGSK